MASGTKIRALTRLLDASTAAFWVIGPAGKIAYLSAGVGQWLGVDANQLVDRRSVAGVPESDHPLDRLAASLSPPPGLNECGTASLRVQPPSIETSAAEPGDREPRDVRFVRVGSPGGLTIAVAGDFDDQQIDPQLQESEAVRQRLDRWRRRHAQLAAIATAGVSGSARRVRLRLQVATSTRTHVGFFGPPGCGSESIAASVHQLSAPGESLVRVDGPLMDPELLDATMIPLINQLADSSGARATALVRGLDEMPLEAQQRLGELLHTYSGRMRLLALCSDRPEVIREPVEEAVETPLDSALHDGPQRGIHSQLIEILSALTVTIEPLSARVEDIPLLAAAVVDARHAAGEGTAERLSRTALDALVVYPWPGNFDELSDAMRHAVRTASRSAIGVEHLPLAIRTFRVGGQPQPASVTSLDQTVRRYELRLIHAAVEAAGGNRAEAARQLGISRARLIRRLAEAEN
jgi:DNA-binding NtrC family response regulator